MKFLFIMLVCLAGYAPQSHAAPADAIVRTQDQIVGIGIVLAQADGKTVIQDFVAEAPALKSGLLHIGDELVAVDKMSGAGQWVAVSGLALEDIVAMIRGDEGTTVGLQLKNGETPYEVTLTREIITVN